MNRNYFLLNKSNTINSKITDQQLNQSIDSDDQLVVSSENNIEEDKIQNYELSKKFQQPHLQYRDMDSIERNIQDVQPINTLQIIDLNDLNLQEIPLEVLSEKDIVNILQLKNNQITDIPSWLVLNLANNQIRVLPSNFKSLNITQLYLQNNELQSIDESITSLKLTHLNLVSNQFTRIPTSFINLLDHLQELSMGWFYLINYSQTITNFQNSEIKILLKLRLVYDISLWVLVDENQNPLLTIFFKAIEINEKGIVQEMIQQYPKLISQIDQKMGSLLFFTYKYQPDYLPLMSTKLNSDNPLLETLLFWAVSKMDLPICTKLLVQKQFNKDLQWTQRKKELSFKLGLYANIQLGDSLFHILFRKQCLAQEEIEKQTYLVGLLIQIRQNCNIKNQQKYCPLHIAIILPSLNCFKLSYENNNFFKFNKKGGIDKQTMYHLIAKNAMISQIYQLENVKLIKLLLLQLNLNILVKNKFDLYAKAYANSNTIVLKYLNKIEKKQLFQFLNKKVQMNTFSQKIERSISNRNSNIEKLFNDQSYDQPTDLNEIIVSKDVFEKLISLILNSCIQLSIRYYSLLIINLIKFKLNHFVKYKPIMRVFQVKLNQNKFQFIDKDLDKHLALISKYHSKILEINRKGINYVSDSQRIIFYKRLLSKNLKLDVTNHWKNQNSEIYNITMILLLFSQHKFKDDFFNFSNSTILDFELYQCSLFNKMNFQKKSQKQFAKSYYLAYQKYNAKKGNHQHTKSQGISDYSCIQDDETNEFVDQVSNYQNMQSHPSYRRRQIHTQKNLSDKTLQPKAFHQRNKTDVQKIKNISYQTNPNYTLQKLIQRQTKQKMESTFFHES